MSLVSFGGGAFGICCGPQGEIYVGMGTRIVKVDLKNGSNVYAGKTVTGKVDGPLLESTFDGLRGLCWSSRSELLVCTRFSHQIRAITQSTVYTYAGTGTKGFLDGIKEKALFFSPTDLVEHNGNIYVADTQNHRIRIINMKSEQVTSIGSGNPNSTSGIFTMGSMHLPTGIDVLRDLNELVVSCRGSQSIMRVDLSAEKIFEFSLPGADGKPVLKDPCGVACAPNGEIYVCDEMNHVLRCIMPDGTVISAFGSNRGRTDGPLSSATTSNPLFLDFSPEGDLYWTEGTHTVRRIAGLANGTKFDLSTFLDQPDFSDGHVVHTASDRQLPCHMSSLLTLLGNDETVAKVTSTLKASPLPFESLHTLLLVIYGHSALSVPGQSQVERARLAAHLFTLSSLANLSGYLPWLENELVRESFRLIEAEFAQLALKLATDEPNWIIPLAVISRVARLKFASPGAKNSVSSRVALEAAFGDTNPEIRDFFIEAVFGLSKPDSLPPIVGANTPGSLASSAMSDLAYASFSWLKEAKSGETEKLSPASSLTTPHFTLAIEGVTTLKVHEWVLWARWCYFERMWRSGMAEVTQLHLTLPSDFPLALLQCILELLYGLPLTSHTRLTREECQYTLENGPQFELSSLDTGLPLAPFLALHRHCTAQVSEQEKQAPTKKAKNDSFATGHAKIQNPSLFR